MIQDIDNVLYIYIIKGFRELEQLEYPYNREKYFYSRIQKKLFSIYSICLFACDSCDTWCRAFVINGLSVTISVTTPFFGL
jgi:hypothetical protein